MKTFNHSSGNTLAIDTAEIYFEETGNSNKPVLLLLHGGFGSVEDFNILLPEFKNEFRIIGIDSRGQGKSSIGKTPLCYELLQSDIESVLKHLGISELSIIGISDGGVVAYRLGSYSDLKIIKLITIGSRWHSDNVVETAEILSNVTSASWKKKFPETVAFYEKVNPDPDFNKLAPQIVNMWMNEKSYPNDNVKNISANTLIIRGDNDHLTKRKFVCDLAENIKDANLSNIAFAGHVVYTEELKVLMLTINRFFEQ